MSMQSLRSSLADEPMLASHAAATPVQTLEHAVADAPAQREGMCDVALPQRFTQSCCLGFVTASTCLPKQTLLGHMGCQVLWPNELPVAFRLMSMQAAITHQAFWWHIALSY